MPSMTFKTANHGWFWHARLLVVFMALVVVATAYFGQTYIAISIATGLLGIAIGLSLGRSPREDSGYRTDVEIARQKPTASSFTGGGEHLEGDRRGSAKRFENVEKDPLTGLCNRIGLESFLAEALSSCDTNLPHCLLFIDLDGFKQVNDALGHSQGDRLLSLCAERIKTVVFHGREETGQEDSSSRIVARFGGDEFVVFIANSGSGNAAQKVANRILRVLSEPFQLGPKSVRVGASIGVAFSPEHGDTLNELVRKADVAMYQAKGRGKNRCEFFHQAMLDAVLKAEKEEVEIREALNRGEFELFFQPLVNAQSLEICSAEALLRWRHPRRGLLLPGDFFPAIERSSLGEAIDEWVINQAIIKAAELERSGTPLMIAVNVSPNRLANFEFPALVRSLVTHMNCSPELLQIEATEDAAVSDPEITLRNLAKLADFGVSVAIDDFGTGYSNLANLLTLPVSRLKIDRSLLREIETRTETQVLVQTIISLANSLGFHSVAEGIETVEQKRILQSMGCDVLQGFLFSHPVNFEKLRSLSPKFQRTSQYTALTSRKHREPRAQAAA